MRCHYMSDLHLESQDFRWPMPQGDVLIVAGDLCHASALDPSRSDPYRRKQRERALRFVETATSAFAHVILVPGNHEHYDGVFEDTVPLLRQHLAGVPILDNETIDIGGVSFVGTTLWTDLAGGNETSAETIRTGLGEYVFVKTRRVNDQGQTQLAKLRPADTRAAHDRAIEKLRCQVSAAGPTVVISHHAPSPQGLNPQHEGNGLDGAFASDLEDLIERLPNTPYWIHGHTHIRKRYRIGNTIVLANCRGFDGKDLVARTFNPNCYFDL